MTVSQANVICRAMNRLMSNLKETLHRRGEPFKDSPSNSGEQTDAKERIDTRNDIFYEVGSVDKKMTV